MRRNIIIFVVFVFMLLAAVGFQYLPGKQAASPPPSNATNNPALPSNGVMRGISLQFHNTATGTANGESCEDYIDEIANTGANTICMVIHGFQEHAGSQSIFIDSRKVPSDERLLELFEHAHKRGLRVMLMPVVLLAKRRGNEWRGQIKPDNWDEWWRDYTHFIVHYAHLARKGRVEVLSVGSELISTETQTKRWNKLIEVVRWAFPGQLTYSANWDHYHVPQFWSQLDIVGMTTYYDLTGGDKPTLERLCESWDKIKKDILRWQATVGKPILFTEVGWPNQVTAAQYPWNYYKSPDKPDPEQQARCFEAFFKTWNQEQNIAGYLVWEWRNLPEQKIDPKTDTSYRPCNKPAAEVIRKYYRKPAQIKAANTTAKNL